ncbi:ATPase [Thermococcus sp. Bubb.Bath]|uniref:ATPase n=1 Tax=Thermococcus sp. Bubb.Bath TaxID=1638242 RepID=UPI00143B6519|nr:ATPase [Thermococcus sp. Bubb.Bath]NJF26128.1 ATPase [Thermococcus sp. Bubb.Bath]
MLRPVEEDFVKRYRLEYNQEALEGVRGYIGEKAYSRLRALIEYRLSGKDLDRSPLEVKIALAFSAGSDSTAALKILRWAGFEVVPVAVRLPQMREDTLKKAEDYGAVFIEIPEYLDVIRPQIEKGAPICGRCHSLVMNAVEEYARRKGIKILASGDLLSSGLISVYQKNGLIVLNLPAFLALDKGEIIEIIGGEYDFEFGCPLLWELFRKAPSTKRLSIQRVLRETRARALTPQMAEELIQDILSR